MVSAALKLDLREVGSEAPWLPKRFSIIAGDGSTPPLAVAGKAGVAPLVGLLRVRNEIRKLRLEQPPGKPQIDKNGVAVKDPATGKAQYVNILQFTGRSWSDEFNTAAIAAIEKAFPGVLDATERVI